MDRQILNGSDWSFKGYVGEDWIWRDAEKPACRDPRGWQAGSVPGSVTHDLLQRGQIPDPYYERNSLLIEWIPARTWVYRKTFRPARRTGRAQLVLRGVDYESRVFLNGERLGRHTGMYTPARFEVGDQLRFGEDNVLAVVIEPAPHEQPQVGYTSQVRTHKSRMTYWWDFCPRMVHQGIWDDVYLEWSGPARIEDVCVRPRLEGNTAHVAVSIQVSSTREAGAGVEIVLAQDGRQVATTQWQQTLAAGDTTLQASLEIADPQLWWPNGSGEQPLYEAQVSLALDEPGAASGVSDRRSVTFGIRRIEFVPNNTPDATARPYTLVANGRKLYIKGWNWVPLDVLYGPERPDKLNRLLRLARQAGVNLLRVWGGGLIEKDSFYDLCDRYGILVWQEFIQSSSAMDNSPSTSPEFIDMLVEQARAIIPLKRNHPALAIWCGGNELQAAGDRPLDDSHPALGALHKVIEELDPDRAWLPTSPSGRAFGNSLESIAADPTGLHDVHGPWHHQGLTDQYTLYNQGTSLLHSEFGVEGCANLPTLQACIAPEHRWPVTRENPYWDHTGAWWLKEATLRQAFGELGDLGSVVRASQFLQAEGLRYAVEADRRRKYRNSGALPWQFNEPFPNSFCTSAVDYYGGPKPAYYAVARAYRPVQLSARFPCQAWGGRTTFEAQVWVNNSHEHAVEQATLRAALVSADGQAVMAHSVTVAFGPNAATSLLDVQWPLAGVPSEVFLLDLLLVDRTGKTLSDARYLFCRGGDLAPLLSLPATALQIQREGEGDEWRLHIANTGEVAALGVWLRDSRPVPHQGWVYFDDNYFSLLPGQSRVITAAWSGVEPAERGIDIQGWNTPVTR